MKIYVKVKAGAKQAKVVKTGDREFAVWVKSPPTEGKANAAVVEILSKYFNRPKSAVSILKGGSSRNKIVEFF